MIRVVASIALFAVLFAHHTAAAQVGGPTDGRRLYLILTGDRTAITEQYVRELCQVIRSDLGGAEKRFPFIRIYKRDRRELTDIHNRLKSNPATSNSSMLDQLVGFADGLESEMPICPRGKDFEQPGKPTKEETLKDDPAATATLLEVEWVSGDSTPTVKVTRATLNCRDRSERSDCVKIDEPRYEALSSETSDSVRMSARKLGILFLDLDQAHLFNIKLDASVPPHERCRVNQRDASCVQLGGTVEFMATVRDTVWHQAKELSLTIESNCKHPSGRERTLRQEMKDGRRSVRFPAKAVGTCGYLVRAVSSLGATTTVTLAFEIQIAAPALLMDSGGEAVQSYSFELYRPRYVPWLLPRTTEHAFTRDIRTFRVATGAEVLAFGGGVRRAITELGPWNDAPELVETMRKRLDRALANDEDLLGYRLLRDLARKHKGIAGAIEPLCDKLSNELLTSVNTRDLQPHFADRWREACVDVISQQRKVLQSTSQNRGIKMLVVSRHPDEKTPVFRIVPALTAVQRAVVDAAKPVLAPQISTTLRTRERFLLQALLGDAQSASVEVTVNMMPTEPNVLFSVSTELVQAQQQLHIGQANGVWFPFLNGIVRAGVSSDIVFGAEIPEIDRYGLRVEVNVDFYKIPLEFCQLGVLASRKCMRAPIYFGGLVGYDVLRQYPLLGVHVGRDFIAGKRVYIRPTGRVSLRMDDFYGRRGPSSAGGSMELMWEFGWMDW